MSRGEAASDGLGTGVGGVLEDGAVAGPKKEALSVKVAQLSR